MKINSEIKHKLKDLNDKYKELVRLVATYNYAIKYEKQNTSSLSNIEKRTEILHRELCARLSIFNLTEIQNDKESKE